MPLLLAITAARNFGWATNEGLGLRALALIVVSFAYGMRPD
jgi:hypothetical protein